LKRNIHTKLLAKTREKKKGRDSLPAAARVHKKKEARRTEKVAYKKEFKTLRFPLAVGSTEITATKRSGE